MILRFKKKLSKKELNTFKAKIEPLIIKKLENDYYQIENKNKKRESDVLIEKIFSEEQKENYQRMQ